MILQKKNSMDYQSLKTHSFVIAKLKVCSFAILGPEKCTYRGIESDKYTTLSAINTFLLLNMQQQHHRQHLFSKMAICIHENRFKECTTVKLSILYKWVSCPSAFLLLSLFKNVSYHWCQKMYNQAPIIFTSMGNYVNALAFRYASPIYHVLL